MRTQQLHFEQVPVILAKKIAEAESGIHPEALCSTCGNPVELERCTVDESGAAVHTECYMARILSAGGIGGVSAS